MPRSTGGKQKLGAITKAGERTLRPLLVIGASAVITQALLKGASTDGKRTLCEL